MIEKAAIQNDHVHVKNNFLFATYGQTITRGWESVPNLLLDYGNKIDLTDSQMMFIIQVGRAIQRNKKKSKTTKAFVKDSDIMMSCSDKTLGRIRMSLSKLKDDNDNQLVDYKTYYNRIDGKIISSGTIYNFALLFDYLFNKFGKLDSFNDVENSDIEPRHLVSVVDNSSNDEVVEDKKGDVVDKMSDTFNKNIRNLRIYKTDTVFKKLILMSGLNPNDDIPYQVGLIDKIISDDENSWILEGNSLNVNIKYITGVTKQYFYKFIERLNLEDSVKIVFR